MVAKWTFECPKCKHQWPVFRDSANLDRVRLRCPACGCKRAKRVYRAPNSISDYEKPIDLVSLKSVRGDPRGYDTVSSVSEHREVLKRHDDLYGTNLSFP